MSRQTRADGSPDLNLDLDQVLKADRKRNKEKRALLRRQKEEREKLREARRNAGEAVTSDSSANSTPTLQLSSDSEPEFNTARTGGIEEVRRSLSTGTHSQQPDSAVAQDTGPSQAEVQAQELDDSTRTLRSPEAIEELELGLGERVLNPELNEFAELLASGDDQGAQPDPRQGLEDQLAGIFDAQVEAPVAARDEAPEAAQVDEPGVAREQEAVQAAVAAAPAPGVPVAPQPVVPPQVQAANAPPAAPGPVPVQPHVAMAHAETTGAPALIRLNYARISPNPYPTHTYVGWEARVGHVKQKIDKKHMDPETIWLVHTNWQAFNWPGLVQRVGGTVIPDAQKNEFVAAYANAQECLRHLVTYFNRASQLYYDIFGQKEDYTAFQDLKAADLKDGTKAALKSYLEMLNKLKGKFSVLDPGGTVYTGYITDMENDAEFVQKRAEQIFDLLYILAVEGKNVSKRILAATTIESIKPKVFNGDPLEYFNWKSQMSRLVESNVNCRPEAAIEYLRMYVSEKIKKELWNLTGDDAYSEGMRLIKSHYASDNALIDGYWEKIHEMTKNPTDTASANKTLLTDLTQYTEILQDKLGQTFATSDTSRIFIRLFPSRLRLEFLRFNESINRTLANTTVGQLIAWMRDKINMEFENRVHESKPIRKKAAVASTAKKSQKSAPKTVSVAATGVGYRSAPSNRGSTARGRGRGRGGRSSGASFSQRQGQRPNKANLQNSRERSVLQKQQKGSTGNKVCYFCKQQNKSKEAYTTHETTKCRGFLQNAVEDRQRLARELGICFNCGKGRHSARDCKATPSVCDAPIAGGERCKRKHHPSLHTSPSK